MKKIKKWFIILYLLTLGIVLGASLYAAIIVAPTIFKSEIYLPNSLNQFQEGILMTQNFIGLRYFILASIIAIFLYEGYQYKSFNRDLIKTLSALGAIMSGALFNYFYMDSIIKMQKQGLKIINSYIFSNMHKGSKIALTLFLIFLLILFIKTLLKELK